MAQPAARRPRPAAYHSVKPDIEQLLAESNGVIRRADHPNLGQRLDRLRRHGELVSPLPGVLCLPERTEDFKTAVLAGMLWAGPDAILTGRAAARMSFWPDCAVGEVEFVVPRRRTARVGRWSTAFRLIPPELVWQRSGIRLTAPSLTAVDLACDWQIGAEAIDEVLRTRTGSLDQMWDAFRSQPNRPGNAVRAALLSDSRDSPWSEGERRLHRLLREARIDGWQTNARVATRGGSNFVDVLFRRQRLVVEFDGWTYHGDRKAFDDDRRRRNELVLAGYRVLNFSWRHLVDDPDWVIRCIRSAVVA